MSFPKMEKAVVMLYRAYRDLDKNNTSYAAHCTVAAMLASGSRVIDLATWFGQDPDKLDYTSRRVRALVPELIDGHISEHNFITKYLTNEEITAFANMNDVSEIKSFVENPRNRRKLTGKSLTREIAIYTLSTVVLGVSAEAAYAAYF